MKMNLTYLIRHVHSSIYYSVFMQRTRNFTHYLELWIRSRAGYRKFRLKNSLNCTSDGILAEGMEYQYREGMYVERIIIESISFSNFYMTFKVYFIEDDRRIDCVSRFEDIGYSGMWRFYDKGTYDIEKCRRQRKKIIDSSRLDDIETIYIS